MSGVRVVDGRPAVVLFERGEIEVLQRILHQANSVEVWRGRPSIDSVIAFVRAARATIVLIDSAVPTAELNSDPEGSIEGTWMTTEETSRLLGIGPRAVRKRVATGTLTGRKVGGVLLIDSKEISTHAA